MEKITNPGTYKAKIINHAVNATKKGFPQLVINILLQERYDDVNDEWVEWSEYEQGGIGYLVLYNAEGELLNNKQVMQATGWDGVDFSELDNLDLSDCIVQVRIDEDEYNGKTQLKVNWIDAEDATPGTGLKKLDASELKSLSKRFLGGKSNVKPAKPKPTPKKTTTKKGKSSPPPPPAPKKSDDEPYGKEEAWAELLEAGEGEKYDDEKIPEAWAECVALTAGDRDESELTSSEWKKVVKEVLNVVEIPF